MAGERGRRARGSRPRTKAHENVMREPAMRARRGRNLAFTGARTIVLPDSRVAGGGRTAPDLPMKSARVLPLLAALMAAALAGCNTDESGRPSLQAAPKEPPTHQEAALECWSATEHGRADLPLDQRADVVDACIKAKMAGRPWPAAAEVKPKPKPAAAPKT
jgi:hypothetical protein